MRTASDTFGTQSREQQCFLWMDIYPRLAQHCLGLTPSTSMDHSPLTRYLKDLDISHWCIPGELPVRACSNSSAELAERSAPGTATPVAAGCSIYGRSARREQARTRSLCFLLLVRCPLADEGIARGDAKKDKQRSRTHAGQEHEHRV